MGMLEGCTALVSGGGSGIGRAIAKRLHEEGAFLFICGRREEKLRESCEFISPTGTRVLGLPADVTRVDEVARLAETVMAQRGGLDVLVNCIGIMRFGTLETLKPGALREMLDVNTIAPRPHEPEAVLLRVLQRLRLPFGVHALRAEVVADAVPDHLSDLPLHHGPAGRKALPRNQPFGLLLLIISIAPPFPVADCWSDHERR